MKRVALMVLMVMALATGVEAGPPDVTPPTIDFVIPNDGATNVQRNISVEVYTSEPIHASTIGGVKLKNLATNRRVPAEITVQAGGGQDWINIDPNRNLPKKTRFKVIVPGTVEDESGNPLGSTYTAVFETATFIED